MSKKKPNPDLLWGQSSLKKIIALGSNLDDIQSSLRIIQERLNNAFILQSQILQKEREKEDNNGT